MENGLFTIFAEALDRDSDFYFVISNVIGNNISVFFNDLNIRGDAGNILLVVNGDDNELSGENGNASLNGQGNSDQLFRSRRQ